MSLRTILTTIFLGVLGWTCIGENHLDSKKKDTPNMAVNDSFNKINSGIYGWIGDFHNIKGHFSPEFDRKYYNRHNINWFFIGHQWLVPYLETGTYNVKDAILENSRRARIWYEVYWWGDHSRWGDSKNKKGFALNHIPPDILKMLKDKNIQPGGDDLRGKDWLAAADDPKVMASIKKTIKWQLDTIIKHCGQNALYGVILSEEEPVHGVDSVLGKEGSSYYSTHKNMIIPKLIKVHNELYDFVKTNYPFLKVSPGFYPDWVKPDTLKMDSIVMDCYPPAGSEDVFIRKWLKAYGSIPPDEHYILLWGYGDNDRQMELERLEKITSGFLQKGYKNIGYFFPALSLYDPIHRLIDTKSTGTYLPYSLKKHSQDVRQLLDDTLLIADKLKTIDAARLPAPISFSPDDWTSREKLIKLTDKIYSFRDKILDDAYHEVLKLKNLQNISNFITLLKAEGILNQNFECKLNMSKTKLREWEILSKDYRTVPAYLKTILPYEKQLVGTSQAVSEEIDKSQAEILSRYPFGVADMIKPFLGRIITFLKKGNIKPAEQEFNKIYKILCEYNLSRCNVLTAKLQNGYKVPLNVTVTVIAELQDNKKLEVYSDYPFAMPDEMSTIRIYLPDTPKTVRLITSRWTGALKVLEFELSKAGQVIKAQRITENTHIKDIDKWFSGESKLFVLAPWNSRASFTINY